MVNISGKLTQIKAMVDRGDYFTINRGRQYGKTTTLRELHKRLEAKTPPTQLVQSPSEYICIRISFEGISISAFERVEVFCLIFMELVREALELSGTVEDSYAASWVDETVTDFTPLSRHITKLCRNRKVILMIDEADASSNYHIYIRFLGMLRAKYLQRRDGAATFQSVILAGVYDIKNIKLKLIKAGSYTPQAVEGSVYNSPWNIAADYEVNMS
ncbi:MAG: hypothetical protein LBT13_04080, partial [Treponema sp.]|nr:hypothetical protein [Treponema sp.]